MILKKKAVLTLVLCLVLLFTFTGQTLAQEQMPKKAPLNLEFERYLENLREGINAKSAGGSSGGLIPVPFKIKKSVSFSPNSIEQMSFPEKFDLRTSDRVTSVKNQGENGSCWAFASYGSLESWLTSKGEEWDFSENHMKNTHGFDWGHNDGGNRDISTAYLTRWSGPVDEKDDPFNPYSGSSPKSLPIQKKVKNVLYLPDREGSLDNNYIKWALTEYGAVYTVYYSGDEYFNSKTNSHYTNEKKIADHAVTIVGWDDNYSKTKFRTTPYGNGAFIVKNSWGDDWGENGYFYVSYYDVTFGEENAVFIDAVNVEQYDSIYQYDLYGITYPIYYDNEGWFLSKYDSSKEEDELLSAVGFYTLQENVAYEIFVDDNVIGNSFKNLKKVKSGILEVPGYHTIDIDPITIEKGKSFAVAVKGLVASHEDFLISIEAPEYDYNSNATANPGETYFSSNGQVWTDTYDFEEDANAILKAFTSTTKKVKVEGISLDKEEMTMLIDSKQQLNVTIFPENAENKDIVWASDNENVAVVDENGLVTAIGEGSTLIRATSVDGNFVVACHINVVKEPVSIKEVNIVGRELEVNIQIADGVDISGTIIIALMNSEGRPMMIKNSIEDVLSKKHIFYIDEELDTDNIDSIKVFLWDSLKNMKPLVDSKIIR